MSVYTIAATILAIIGIIAAIIGTGFFVVGNNYKQSIITLKEALGIYKEAGIAKDSKIDELNKKMTSLGEELNISKNQNLQLRTLNLDLQNEVVYWRLQVVSLHRTYNLPPVTAYDGNGQQNP